MTSFLTSIVYPSGKCEIVLIHFTVSCEINMHYSSFSMQPDRLSTLPAEILLRLTGVLSTMFANKQPEDRSFDVPTDQAEPQGEETTYQPMRLCCRTLRDACDASRTSIGFFAKDQANMTNLLPRVRLGLVQVRIIYTPDSSNIQHSLTNLHSILPGLTSLLLEYQPAPEGNHNIEEGNDMEEDNPNPDVAMTNLVLLWRDTLRRLKLTNVTCTPSVGIPGDNGLMFLSHLLLLQTLELAFVFPFLTGANVAGCAILTRLDLEATNDDQHDIDLDLSRNTNLRYVDVADYNIQHFNVTGLIALETLYCYDNRLEDLDLTTCIGLENLGCCGNPISELDLTNCPRLLELECSSEELSELNLTGCTLLTELKCDRCNLQNLDLSTCLALETLHCEGISGTLDVRSCLSLQILDAHDSPHLVNVHITGLTQLTEVHLLASVITSLNMTGCTSLRIVECENCAELIWVTSIPASIVVLGLHNCDVHQLDLTGCVHLQSLCCIMCPLEVLDLSSCVSLETMICDNTGVKSLDLSSAAASLVTLSCQGCVQLLELRAVGCSNMVTLDVSHCDVLEFVSCVGCDSLGMLSCSNSGVFSGSTVEMLRLGIMPMGVMLVSP